MPRTRAFLSFLAALVYFYFAQNVASHAARGFTRGGTSFLLVHYVLLLFLLLVGFAGMGFAFQRQTTPLRSMGLGRRPGWLREFAVGSALGWGLLLACVLPIVLFGGYHLTVWTNSSQYLLLILDLCILLLAALAEEIVFRGYPFQRLIDSLGPTMGTLLMAVVFALMHIVNPGWTPMSMIVTILAGWLLSIAYLRTRALWLPWGLHFAWNAAMGLLFGLPISGQYKFSPVFQALTSGPIWLTGGDYGPEGSLVAALVMIAGMFVLVRATRDYAYRYTQPVIVPGGIPVDIDAAARRQHEAAMGPAEPAAPTLIQIAPAPSVAEEFTGIVDAPAVFPDRRSEEPTAEPSPERISRQDAPDNAHVAERTPSRLADEQDRPSRGETTEGDKN